MVKWKEGELEKIKREKTHSLTYFGTPIELTVNGERIPFKPLKRKHRKARSCREEIAFECTGLNE